MGFGHRKFLHIIPNKANPSPCEYTISSCFDYDVKYKKGYTIVAKPKSENTKKKFVPGVGTYNISSTPNNKMIKIKLRSRLNFFYDDDLKKKKFTVSMQRYHPSFKLVQPSRYSNIIFGYGSRSPNENVNIKSYPGPGAYNVPGCFDRGLKGKLVLN